MAISPAALIESLPVHERELLEAFGVWRLRARPASGTSALLRLSSAGDKNPALRPHILAALRAPDARFTVEGVLLTAEAMLGGGPAPVVTPLRAPSRQPAPAVALTLTVPSAEEIDRLIEEEEVEPEYGDLFPIVPVRKSAPAGVIATAWGWREEAVPPRAPSASASTEASTPAERTAWLDSAFGPADAPAPTLDSSAPSEVAEVDLDGEIMAIAPAYVLEGQSQTAFVRSRSVKEKVYSVLIARGGRAISCSCPSTRPTCHGAPEWVEKLVAGVEVKPEEGELKLKLELEAKLKEAELEEGESLHFDFLWHEDDGLSISKMKRWEEAQKIREAAQRALDAEIASFGEPSGEAWAFYHASLSAARALEKGRVE